MPRVPVPGRDRLLHRRQQPPRLRDRPRQRRGRDLRSLPGQARRQRVRRPARLEPLHQQHRDEPIREQALPDRLRRPRRHHRRRPLAPALSLIAALAVRDQPDDDLPVQLLPGPVIAQEAERLPASRAAVPAAREVPEHLEPRQPRVVPPPRTRPGTAFHLLLLLPAVRLPAVTGAGIIIVIVTAAVRSRAGFLRRPAEHDPLQHRDRGVRLGQLLSLPADQLPQLLADPDQLRVLLPQLPDLPGLLLDLRRLLLDDLQRTCQQPLSGRSARRRRPGTARARQNTGHRSHEPQETPSARRRHPEHANSPQLTNTWRRESLHRICEDLRQIGRVGRGCGPPWYGPVLYPGGSGYS